MKGKGLVWSGLPLSSEPMAQVTRSGRPYGAIRPGCKNGKLPHVDDTEQKGFTEERGPVSGAFSSRMRLAVTNAGGFEAGAALLTI